MMSTADRLVLRVRGNPVTLDALAQWAMTPVRGVTAYPPDHTLIIRNLERRFGISREEAVGRYMDLRDAVAAVDLDFSFGFIGIRDELKGRILADGILTDAIAKRVRAAPLRERVIVWLYCSYGERIFGNGGAGKGSDREMQRFLALLRATSDMSASEAEVRDLLVRTGCADELEATIEDYPHVMKKRVLVPAFLIGEVWPVVQDTIDLPRPPDFTAYLERRIRQGMLSELVALEEILEADVAPAAELTGECTPERGLIEERDGCFAVNALIAAEARERLLSEKEVLAEANGAPIAGALAELYDRHYPAVSCQRRDLARGVLAWEVCSAGEDLLIVHAPWLTGSQMRRIAGLARVRGCVLVCSGIMGIPEAERLIPRACQEQAGDAKDLILADIRPGRRAARVQGEKPALYDEWFAMTGEARVDRNPSPDPSEEEKHSVLAADPVEVPERQDPGLPMKDTLSRMTEPGTVYAGEPAIQRYPVPEDEDMEQYLIEHIPPRPDGLHIFLGTTERGEEVAWSPGDLLNGHCIIIGGSGAGKTETIRCISSELERQGYPVLLIDFHGDMANRTGYARTYEIREGGAHYFNPLDLDRAFSEITPLRATSDFVDAIFINFPTLGIQQREHLVEIISDCYARAGITASMKTWDREMKFADIREAISTSDDKTTQTIRAYMGDIFRYNLFQSTEKISISRVLDGGITHLNLRALPESLRSLYADLILRKLYYSVQSLGEIPRGDTPDRDRFRIFVIVDEAKLLVGEKQGIKAVLNKYATELRKFGVGIILASQLVGHFNDEILANIAVKFCMKAETKRQARENCKYFEFEEKELLNLRQGEGILVTGSDRKKIRIVPTWERQEE